MEALAIGACLVCLRAWRRAALAHFPADTDGSRAREQVGTPILRVRTTLKMLQYHERPFCGGRRRPGRTEPDVCAPPPLCVSSLTHTSVWLSLEVCAQPITGAPPPAEVLTITPANDGLGYPFLYLCAFRPAHRLSSYSPRVDRSTGFSRIRPNPSRSGVTWVASSRAGCTTCGSTTSSSPSLSAPQSAMCPGTRSASRRAKIGSTVRVPFGSTERALIAHRGQLPRVRRRAHVLQPRLPRHGALFRGAHV
jgi:hypothetical protein